MAKGLKVIVGGEPNNIIVPRSGDLGFDLIASDGPNIIGKVGRGGHFKRVDYIEYDTGVKLDTLNGLIPLIFPRSSISKTNLLLCNSVGLVDLGYRGNLILRFKYIWQPEDYVEKAKTFRVNPEKIYQKGDRIGQVVFQKPYIPDLTVGELSNTDRGDDGFGSTGS